MFEVRTLLNDGSLLGDDMDKSEITDLVALVGRWLTGGDGVVTRLTINGNFGSIEIIPQGGLSLLTE